MAYFPLFIDLEHMPCLVVGGGTVAKRKVKALLSCGAEVTVVAKEWADDLQSLQREYQNLSLWRHEYRESDLDGMYMAVAAADDLEVNLQVADDAKRRGIRVNSAEPPEAGNFIFPAYIRRGGLSVGISTGGQSPAASRYLREEIEKIIPEHIEEVLLYMEEVRPRILARIPEQKKREKVLRALFQAALHAGRGLEKEEEVSVISEAE